jgi:hypothetical protein
VQQTGGISNTPAAVEFNSNMYTFYERDHVFYYNTYDGEVWSGEVQVQNTGGVNGGVVAAVINQTVYLFYSNPNQSTLLYRMFDGTAFGAETAVTDHYSNLDTPAAAVLDDILYVFCRGPGPNEPGNSNRFWYAAYDGRLWHDGNVGNTGGIGNGPGATAYELPDVQQSQRHVLLQDLTVRTGWLIPRSRTPRAASAIRAQPYSIRRYMSCIRRPAAGSCTRPTMATIGRRMHRCPIPRASVPAQRPLRSRCRRHGRSQVRHHARPRGLPHRTRGWRAAAHSSLKPYSGTLPLAP